MVGLALMWPVAHTRAESVVAGIHLQVADGTLVKAPADPRVYLVDRGALRHVTGTSYRRLYAGFRGICTVVEIPHHLVQEPLGDGTRLVKTRDDPHVWLVDNGHTKRHVSSVPVFRRYGFSWHRVQIVPPEMIDFLPEGPRLR
jgi:hypothetical protein